MYITKDQVSNFGISKAELGELNRMNAYFRNELEANRSMLNFKLAELKTEKEKDEFMKLWLNEIASAYYIKSPWGTNFKIRADTSETIEVTLRVRI